MDDSTRTDASSVDGRGPTSGAGTRRRARRLRPAIALLVLAALLGACASGAVSYTHLTLPTIYSV